MGEVVRPAVFARVAALRPDSGSLASDSQASKSRYRIGRVNRALIPIVFAVIALGWILTLAGAAFAVRVTLLLFFAALAGRARRVGAPVYAPIRLNRRR
jgi:hypothetical protein